ncbi:hypothetical protein LTR60_007089, partial [Cryomyces antarcticus]
MPGSRKNLEQTIQESSILRARASDLRPSSRRSTHRGGHLFEYEGFEAFVNSELSPTDSEERFQEAVKGSRRKELRG